jgi:hypothetical protein
MTTALETASSAPRANEETLRRILDLLERGHRRTWMEVACAVILSLATTCSAWCAYQSKIWSGVQGAVGSQAGAQSRKAARNVLIANQIRSLEAAVFIKFFEAKQAGDDKLAQFYADRLPAQTKLALAAWWKTNPRENPQAPNTPFDMAEYKQSLLDEAHQQEDSAAEIGKDAAAAGRNSDTYVLLTVLFASALFFGGIGNTFESRRLRRTMIYIAIVLFSVTFITLLVGMPIKWEWPLSGS